MPRYTYSQIFEASRVKANKMPKDTGWQDRHFRAWYGERHGYVSRHGSPVSGMIDSIGRYADTHFARYESKISEDYVLGPEWLNMLKACRVLLNGELGQLDGGICDGLILAMAANEGFNVDDL